MCAALAGSRFLLVLPGCKVYPGRGAGSPGLPLLAPRPSSSSLTAALLQLPAEKPAAKSGWTLTAGSLLQVALSLYSVPKAPGHYPLSFALVLPRVDFTHRITLAVFSFFVALPSALSASPTLARTRCSAPVVWCHRHPEPGFSHWQMEPSGCSQSHTGFNVTKNRAWSRASWASVLSPTALQDGTVYTRLCRM